MQKDKKVELQKICYDVKLNPDTEEKLRDGLFNMETIRFGKIPEIMIKKMFSYQEPSGTTEYDLVGKDDNGIEEHIEVKFSCVREKKKTEINDENALQVCIDNSEMITNRKISVAEYELKEFDCNIQQVKPEHFSKLYYGLFFEDQIALFMITSQDLKKFFVTKRFKEYENKLMKINKTLKEIKTRLESDKDKDILYIKRRLEGKIKESIPELLIQLREALEKINSEQDEEPDEAKKIIEKNSLLDDITGTIVFIEDKDNDLNLRYKKVLEMYEKGMSVIEQKRFPNLSTKQHRGNNGEGQFHITNMNIKWHLNSDYFLGWLSYRELYDILENK